MYYFGIVVVLVVFILCYCCVMAYSYLEGMTCYFVPTK